VEALIDTCVTFTLRQHIDSRLLNWGWCIWIIACSSCTPW